VKSLLVFSQLTGGAKYIMKTIVSLFAFILTINNAFAETPQSGVWSIDVENTGLPGRGFQIEAQDNFLVMTFYGYNSDGSPTFYLTAAPIVNDSAVGNMEMYSGGSSLGGPLKPATYIGSAGTVRLDFTNAVNGYITLPGETRKSITKLNWTPPDPVGLLGEWVFVFDIITTFADRMRLTNIGPATSTGNGVVYDNSPGYIHYICERNTSGMFAGDVLCFEYNSSGQATDFAFRWNYSRDAGSGRYISLNTGNEYPMLSWRTRYKDGNVTSHSVTNTNDFGSSDDTSILDLKSVQDQEVVAQKASEEIINAIQSKASSMLMNSMNSQTQ